MLSWKNFSHSWKTHHKNDVIIWVYLFVKIKDNDRFYKNRLVFMVLYGVFLDRLSLTSILIPILFTLRCGRRLTMIHRYSFIWNICHIKIHVLSKNSEVPFDAFFWFAKNWYFRRKYRFSLYRYTIPVRKFEIRILSDKLHIVYKNHRDSP